jgi:hypothetical protein
MQQGVSTSPPVQRGSAAQSVYPWVLVAMLWAVSFCNYADRSVLSAVMPAIRTGVRAEPGGARATQLCLSVGLCDRREPSRLHRRPVQP